MKIQLIDSLNNITSFLNVTNNELVFQVLKKFQKNHAVYKEKLLVAYIKEDELDPSSSIAFLLEKGLAQKESIWKIQVKSTPSDLSALAQKISKGASPTFAENSPLKENLLSKKDFQLSLDDHEKTQEEVDVSQLQACDLEDPLGVSNLKEETEMDLQAMPTVEEIEVDPSLLDRGKQDL